MRSIFLSAFWLLAVAAMIQFLRTPEPAFGQCRLEGTYNCLDDGDSVCDYPTCGFQPELLAR